MWITSIVHINYVYTINIRHPVSCKYQTVHEDLKVHTNQYCKQILKGGMKG